MTEPFLGEVKLFGFNFNPRGWAKCDGQLLPINQNQSLYSLLGTTYGGDGRTDFALPDLRGRAAAHRGPANTLGTKAGAEAVGLSDAEMPNHTHQLAAYSDAANSNNPTGRRLAQAGVSAYHPPDPANTVQMNAGALGNTGTNTPHENMQPFTVVNFCIALQGLFPSRN